MGAMEELQTKVGAAWVRMYSGDLSATDLRAAQAWAQEVAGQRPDLAALAWEEVGKETWRAFHEVLNRAETSSR